MLEGHATVRKRSCPKRRQKLIKHGSDVVQETHPTLFVIITNPDLLSSAAADVQ